jgi:hypothetical protein
MAPDELDNIFGDVNQATDPEMIAAVNGMDVNQDTLNQAAQQFVSTPPQQSANVPEQQQAQMQTVAPPPSEPVRTEADKEWDKYNERKKKLFDLEDQLFKLSHSDKSGSIIRNFGLSQLVLMVGDEIDRLNGLVVFRSLKAKCKRVSVTKDGKDATQEKNISDGEELAHCLYEVWGIMEDGSVGLTSSYDPSMVQCVISLRSGYDMPPDIS